MIKTLLVGNDAHHGYENKKACNCFVKVAEIVKPWGIRLNGDMMSCDSFSRHDIAKAPKSHWTNTEFYEDSLHEYRKMSEFLCKLERAAPKADKEYLLGNHEQWLIDFIKADPTRTKDFSLEARLPLKELGWKTFPYRQIRTLGKLLLAHGFYTGANHAKKHVDSFGKSILYGDTHDIQVWSKVTPLKESFMAWSNGCLCDMNPHYLRNRPQNWNHCLALVHVWPNGNYQVDQHRINNGKVIIDGEVIEG